MAIPLEYNLRSAVTRWPSTLVAILSIAGTVAVFIVMLAMAQGFQATSSRAAPPTTPSFCAAGRTAR